MANGGFSEDQFLSAISSRTIEVLTFFPRWGRSSSSSIERRAAAEIPPVLTRNVRVTQGHLTLWSSTEFKIAIRLPRPNAITNMLAIPKDSTPDYPSDAQSRRTVASKHLAIGHMVMMAQLKVSVSLKSLKTQAETLRAQGARVLIGRTAKPLRHCAYEARPRERRDEQLVFCRFFSILCAS